MGAPISPNRASSPLRVRAPGRQSSSACIRLPAPAGSTRLALRKSRNWRRGIGPTGVAPTAAIDVVGLDPSLQRLVGCIQPLIHRIGFRLYALDDSGCGGFFTARLESRPKHLRSSRERRHQGYSRDNTYSNHNMDLDPVCTCVRWLL